VPNPFRASTTIGFDLPRAEHVHLSIFDIGGRRVKTLARGGLLESGSHSFEWNGRDDGGALLATGLYFCRLEAGSASETRRIVFAR
jgi:flagellar hook assembly protein FlgD